MNDSGFPVPCCRGLHDEHKPSHEKSRLYFSALGMILDSIQLIVRALSMHNAYAPQRGEYGRVSRWCGIGGRERFGCASAHQGGPLMRFMAVGVPVVVCAIH
jgi:hypothetical protein